MIWIFGDSFASSDQDLSWTSIIGDTQNFASNGSSEYRILKNYLLQKSNIKENDLVLFVHTSQSRIFLKDDRELSSRMLSSHTNCDIIFNDVFEKKEKQYIEILELIWDDEFFNDIFDLIVDKLLGVPNSHHLTFFESPRTEIVNLNHIWLANQGEINHMNETGNRLVADYIKQLKH
jgi:hypothetical protein